MTRKPVDSLVQNRKVKSIDIPSSLTDTIVITFQDGSQLQIIPEPFEDYFEAWFITENEKEIEVF